MLESNDPEINSLGELLLREELKRGACVVRYYKDGKRCSHTFTFCKGMNVDTRFGIMIKELKKVRNDRRTEK